jgi:single-stranded DNA-binding protein
MPLNKVYFSGNVTEVKDGEKAFAFFVRSVETYNDNEYETVARFVAFKKTAEQARATIKKGDQIIIEGRLSSRKKEGDNGTFYNLEAVAEKFLVVAPAKVDTPKAPAKDDNIPF